VAAKALILLNLLKSIYDNTKHLKEGFINISCDNSKVVGGIANGIVKAMEGIQDRGTVISRCIELIKKIKIYVFVELVEGHSKKNTRFIDNPG